MQFMSLELPADLDGQALYFATHDGSAHFKTFETLQKYSKNHYTSQFLGVSVTPEGAADPRLLSNSSGYVLPFPIVLGIVKVHGVLRCKHV